MLHVGDMVADRVDMPARFGATFGLDPWVQRVQGWTLIGLSAATFGKDGNGGQAVWLRNLLEGMSGPIGLFLHFPWHRCAVAGDIPAGTRHLLERLFEGHDLRFVLQGHSHMLQGSAEAWAPAIGLVEAEGDGTMRLAGLSRVMLDGACHRFEHLVAPGAARTEAADYATVFVEGDLVPA